MKKFIVVLMMVTLLLSAACGKQPQNAVTPTAPSEPPTQAPTQPVTEAPTQAPTEPATEPATEAPTEAPTEPTSEPLLPEVYGPEGFTLQTRLRFSGADAEAVLGVAPMDGDQLALLVQDGQKAWLMLYDCGTCEVTAKQQVELNGDAVLVRMDKESFYFADGQRGWEVAADGSFSMTEYRLEDRLHMGDRQVSAINGSLYIDGQPVLEATPGSSEYLLVAVLDDHRLLYNAYGAATNLQGTYGVYDHTTGEKTLLTTLGQYVVGVWGDTLLITRQTAGGMYELGKYDLTDYSFMALSIGHETVDRRVESVLCNDAGTRLMVTWADDSGTTVQIFDLEIQVELYRWTAPVGQACSYFPVGDDVLLVWTEDRNAPYLWKVEY